MTAPWAGERGPHFVTFEGPEGSGKSTNVAWLAARLERAGRRVVVARDPGSTVLGEGIRQLVLHGEELPTANASMLLFEAARAQLVTHVIQPALARGDDVICDRFADSTLAYQGYGEGVSLDAIRMLNVLATGGLVPDVTVLLDLDPLIGLQRRHATLEWNQMEGREIEFHRRVRSGFLALAAADRRRWLVVDAGQPLTVVQAALEARIVQARGSVGGASAS